MHDKRGAFRQFIGKAGQRKRVAPFDQLMLGLRDLFAEARVAHNGVPEHMAVWFPEMGQAGLRWQPSPYILTGELLEPKALHALVTTHLAGSLTGMQTAAVGRVIGVRVSKSR